MTKTITLSIDAEAIDNRLTNAVVYLVNNLDRGKDKDGKPYRGLRQDRCALTTVFFSLMVQWKHPLAGVRNDKCSHDNPCNQCQRDVYEYAVQSAVDQGLIIRQGRKGGTFRNDKTGKLTQGRGYVMFYRQDEFVGNKEISDDFMATMLAKV